MARHGLWRARGVGSAQAVGDDGRTGAKGPGSTAKSKAAEG